MKVPNVKCFLCQKNCYIPQYRIKTFKYCSRACKDRCNSIKIQQTCQVCGTHFEHISSRCNKAKYCSRLCYHRSQISKGTKEYKCLHCNKLFFDSPSHNRKYCSKRCTSKKNIDDFTESYAVVRKKMTKENLFKNCEICGYDKFPEILGVHHIDKNPENNEKINLKILCANCHSLEHRRHIKH